MNKKFLLIPIAILAGGFILMLILMSFREEPERIAAQPKIKLVNAKVITLQNVSSNITAYGRLNTAHPLTLYSEVNGTLVRGDIPFQPAQKFNRGDLLIKIDDRQIHLDINSAKSDFLNALATVLPEIKVDFPEEFPTWQAYFERCGFDKELSVLPETSNQKIKLYLSRFNIYKLYFQSRNLEIQAEKHYFYAPFNGSIVTADLRPGATARAGTRLGEIINLEKMEVEVPVPARDLKWIDNSKPVNLTSSEIDGTWTGKIQRIGKIIDDNTQTVQVFISIGNSHKEELFDGIFLKAEIPGRVIKNAVSVPRNIIYGNEHIYIVDNGQLKKQKIDIIRTEMETAIITNGLQTGDTLVVDILQGVADGMLAKAIL